MARKKILVVDDDPEVRLALELRLKANGRALFRRDCTCPT